jgi:hypothetical protein
MAHSSMAKASHWTVLQLIVRLPVHFEVMVAEDGEQALQQQQQGKERRQIWKEVVGKWLMPVRPGSAGRTPLLSRFLIIMLMMHADNISAAAATVHD